MCPIFVGSVHNFDKSDNDLFSEKVLISDRCISGLMSNFIKKSWTDSNVTYSIKSSSSLRHDGHFFPVWLFTAFGFEGRVTATKAIWREIALVSKNFHVETNSSIGDTKTYGYFLLKEYNYYFEIVLAQRSQ